MADADAPAGAPALTLDSSAQAMLVEAARLLRDFSCWAYDGPPQEHQAARAGELSRRIGELVDRR